VLPYQISYPNGYDPNLINSTIIEPGLTKKFNKSLCIALAAKQNMKHKLRQDWEEWYLWTWN
jgi:hypothetical protein